MSASLQSEELPRRNAEPSDRILLVKFAAEIAWPMPLSSLENLPITLLDDFWPEVPATAYGQTDGNKTRYNGIRNERNVGQHVRQHQEG